MKESKINDLMIACQSGNLCKSDHKKELKIFNGQESLGKLGQGQREISYSIFLTTSMIPSLEFLDYLEIVTP
jgi:hypothetical protein